MKTRYFIYILAIGFFLNFVWENSQFILYGGTTTLYPRPIVTALGTLVDVCIIMVIYAIMAAIFKNTMWLKAFSLQKGIMSIVLGFIAIVINEKVGLGLNAWYYAEKMPVLPWLKIGLTPALQMTILPLLTFYITGFIIRNNSRNFN